MKIILWTVSLGLLLNPVLASGQIAENQEESVLRTTTNLVLVDVRVRDKSGRTMKGLSPEDFKLYEEDELQTLSLFSFENIEGSEEQETPSSPVLTLDRAGDVKRELPSTRASEITRNRRLLVLFFDQTSMPVENLTRVLRGVREFIQYQLSPADLVSVVSYTSSLRLLQDFTHDRDLLLAAVDQIQVGESAALAPPGTEGEEGVVEDVSAAFTPDETEFNIFNTDQKLAAIESLARMLRGIPGRKVVIHFSSGVTRTGSENLAQLRATIDAANQSNLSLYTVDARGLVAAPPGGATSTSGATGTAIYSGEAQSNQVKRLLDSRDTLLALAKNTGGRAFYDLNDFRTIFRQVQKESSSYYLLGYYSSHSEPDGKFRRIRVQVTLPSPARPGLRIDHRPGYFAPKEFEHLGRGARERQLVQALNLAKPFVDLPLAVETSHFRLPKSHPRGSKKTQEEYFVVLSAKIPGKAVPFAAKSGHRKTEFDFVWRATDNQGKTAAILRDTLPVKMDPDSYAQLLRSNLLYQGGVVLPSGKYDLKVVVRENLTGKVGTFEQALRLPQVQDSELTLSSVVVSNQIVENSAKFRRGRPGRKKRNPLVIRERRILPHVTKVFQKNQPLYVYFQAYGTRRNRETTSPQLYAGVVLIQHGKKAVELGPLPAIDAGDGQSPAFFLKIPLDRVRPGSWWLQVHVLDTAGKRAAFSRIPIAVMKAKNSKLPVVKAKRTTLKPRPLHESSVH